MSLFHIAYLSFLILQINEYVPPVADFALIQSDRIQYAASCKGHLTGVDTLIPSLSDTQPDQEFFLEIGLNNDQSMAFIQYVKPFQSIQQWIADKPAQFAHEILFKANEDSTLDRMKAYQPEDLLQGKVIRCFYDKDFIPIHLQILSDGKSLQPFVLTFFPDEKLVSRNTTGLEQPILWVTYTYDESKRLVRKDLWNLRIDDYQDLIKKQLSAKTQKRPTFEDLNLVPMPRIWTRMLYSYNADQHLIGITVLEQSRYVDDWIPKGKHSFRYKDNLLEFHRWEDPLEYPIYEEYFYKTTIPPNALIQGIDDRTTLSDLYQQDLLFDIFIKYKYQSDTPQVIVKREENGFGMYNSSNILLKRITNTTP